MKKIVFVLFLMFSVIVFGCSKSSLEKIDFEAIKYETEAKKEDFEKIQEKIKKIKKKL